MLLQELMNMHDEEIAAGSKVVSKSPGSKGLKGTVLKMNGDNVLVDFGDKQLSVPLNHLRLDELLNSDVKYDVIKDSANKFQTIAKIGDRFITFSAYNDGDQGWDVAFYESKDHHSPHTYGKTGSGDELKVFSMVMASFKEFLDRYHPDVITFTADKDGESDTRAKLYSRIASKYLKGFTGEKFEHGKTTHFRYTKDEE